MKSFGLLRTNVALTTNIKIVVDSNYKLSLDSIESDPSLSLDKFKKVSFIKDNYYDELIPFFYKDLPSDVAFKVKYDNDSDTMSNNFAYQYDELYNYGARNIFNNKSYSEEFEYFAPLYFTKNGIPDNFIIFRVDGPGLGNLSSNNFKDEILLNLKLVKIFNLTKETQIGEWIDRNFISNKFFPDSSLDIDFRRLEFSRWNGIDYKNGGYAFKSLFIDDILDEEKEIFELEKFVTDSYRSNGIVYPNILNLSFLFDDTPSTPDFKRKWSINRYYGFYVDKMDFVKTISPYRPSELRSDVVIVDNLLVSENENPFTIDWSDDIPFYVEIDSIYYRVERYSETIPNKLIKKPNTKVDDQPNRVTKGRGGDSIVKRAVITNTNSFIEDYGDLIVYKYRIISDIDLSGITYSSINKNYSFINNVNRIVINDVQDPYILDGFEDADVWLIEIDGVYHNLIKEGDYIKLNTDYSFKFNLNDYTYRVNGFDKKVDILLYGDDQPKKFSIYKLKFSDIKDFDTNIVDTEYSKYEYEKVSEITNTDETKMYLESIDSVTNPPDLDDFNYKNEVINIPVSSEYIVNYELFKINEVDGIKSLSDIWRKNPVHCRWVYQNSISGNDVPYLLNNSLIFEDFNRTTNVFDPDPKRYERNLDYFYTYIDSSSDSIHSDYLHQSLHVQSTFDFRKYLNVFTYSVGSQSLTYNYDYFNYFFSKSNMFLTNRESGILKNVNKFSYFNLGDDTLPNSTLFRGIKFEIYEVSGVSLLDDLSIDRINIKSSNKFNDYKLSILLSDNDIVPIYNLDNTLNSVDVANNSLSWIIIDEWFNNQEYSIDDIVISNGILYQLSIQNSFDKSPVELVDDVVRKSRPGQGWIYIDSVFWKPSKLYSINEYVYNNNEYYFLNSENGVDFWSPDVTYNINSIVLFLGKYYSSIIDNNIFAPDESKYWSIISDKIDSEVRWEKVEIWNPSLYYYETSPYIIKNGILYSNISTEDIKKIGVNEEPGVSKLWKQTYSFIPDTDFEYTNVDNSIIYMNNRYYKCTSSPKRVVGNLATLDNGIIIYINEKYKNILININISDNTYPDIIGDAGVVRDELYNSLYSKLTAANFIKAVNDITNKYEFTDYVKYVITDSSGGTKRYDRSNIIDLPYIIKCEEPDILNVKIDSLKKSPISSPIKSTRSLDNGKIINIAQLNYYNNIPIGANVIENKDSIPVFDISHGNKNVVNSTMYRYSGYYMPLFYDIQLFDNDGEFSVTGNYRFNVSLTNFGIVKERKIRKVNRRGSILKLDNFPDEKSIFPMLDEFGYTTYDFFMFSSTWDDKYYLENSINTNDVNFLVKNNVDDLIKVKNISIPKNIGLIK